MNPLVLAAAGAMALAVGWLLVGEASGRQWLRFGAKPAASLVFVVVAARLFEPGEPYDLRLLLGLLLCMAGDVLLLFPAAFLAGLVVFLLGHVAYVTAFATLAPPASWPVAIAAGIGLAGVAVLRWLWAHLGRMRLAVIAYVLVISAMAWAALSVWRLGAAPWLVAAGALLFYVSDLAVARDRFIERGFANRAWGLPTYYLGQLLLALSML